MMNINILKTGHAEIKISVKKNFRTDITADGNGYGMLMGAVQLIESIARETNEPYEKILNDIGSILKTCRCITCESAEQREVIDQMIKNGMFPGVEK